MIRILNLDFHPGLRQLGRAMPKKKTAKKARTINQRFTALERLVRFEFRGLRKEMNERFAVMEDRIDRLATHVDGFMKLN